MRLAVRVKRQSRLSVVFGLATLALLSLSLVQVAARVPGGLALRACFNDAGGLEAGDDVLLRGYRVGHVTSVELDDDYRPCAELDVDAKLALADDTSAMILSVGVLGGRAINLEPGGSEIPLTSGDEIAYTQSALVIERVIGKFVTGFTGDR